MSESSCRRTRSWLQAPGELEAEEAVQVMDHLSRCPACSRARVDDEAVDLHLSAFFSSIAPVPSVRPHVRARLQEKRVARRGRRSMRREVLTPAFAAIAVLLALLGSQMIPGRGQGPAAVNAAWRVVRADIGYPMTIDARHPNHLLAGSNGRVYESWNAGDTWRALGPLPQRSVIRDVSIDRTDATRYLVATKHSVFLSTDGGKRWRSTATSLRGAMNMFLVQDPAQPRTYFLGPSVLWTSHDRGEHWQPAGPGNVFAPNGIQGLAFGRDHTLYTAIWGGRIAVSRNAGLTWQREGTGLWKNVLGVTLGPGGILWAATEHGVFRSPTGQQWRPTTIPSSFLTTSIIASGRYVLAGGKGGIWRSHDGGSHWSLSDSGLPLDPYIYGLFADPSRPRRVYASLDSDGLFRSDDAGRTWIAITRGLPLDAPHVPANLVLFRRGGELWITDSTGTDPGNLTVDTDVAAAALSPDDAAVAYLAERHDRWALRLLSAGGSTARTVRSGTDNPPGSLLWSPSGASVALLWRGQVGVAGPAVRSTTWRLEPDERVVGWATDAQSLLSWQPASGRVVERNWRTGAVVRAFGEYPSAPIPAPDGTSVAYVSNARLYIGTWTGRARPVAGTSLGCAVISWSEDSSRVLLRCRRALQVWSRSGKKIYAAPLGAAPQWAPGSDRSLLLFRHGDLWRWSVAGTARVDHGVDPVSATAH